MNKLTSKILTSQGGRAENQDFAGETITNLGYLYVVCDGMGGANGGRLASETAVKTIIDNFKLCQEEPAKGLKNSIEIANKVIYEKATENEELQGMGTTVVALLISGNTAITAHAGDSRIYHLRKSKILFRTADHSVVAERLKKGIIKSEEEARTAKDKNRILRALGTDEGIEIDINKIDNIKNGDRFLLCSDGIWENYSEKILVAKLCKSQSVETIVQKLIQDINLEANQKGGGHDNLTAILIEIGSKTKPSINNKSSKKISMKSKILNISLITLIVVALIYIITLKVQYSDFTKATENMTKEEREKLFEDKSNLIHEKNELQIEIQNKDTTILKLGNDIKSLKKKHTQEITKLKNLHNTKVEKVKRYIYEFKATNFENLAPINKTALDSINNILK